MSGIPRGRARPWSTWWFDAQKCVAPGDGLAYIYLPKEARTLRGPVKPGIHRARRAGRNGYDTLGGQVDFEDVAYWQPFWHLGGERHKDMIEIKDSVDWEEQDV